MKRTPYFFLLGIMLALASSCSESNNETCLSGTLDCSCINGTRCDFGLICENEVCVEKTSDTATYPIDSDTGTGMVTDTETETGQPVDTETDTGEPDSDTGEPDSDTGEPDSDTGTPDTATIDDSEGGTDTANEDCLTEVVKGWDASFASQENDFLSQINTKRAEGASCGTTQYDATSPLVMDPDLQCANRYFVYEKLESNYDPTKITTAALSVQAMAEGFNGTVLAVGGEWGSNTEYQEVAKIVEFFMNDSTKCKQLMNPKAEYLGVGYGLYLSDHIWVYSTGR